MKIYTNGDPAFAPYPPFQLGGELIAGLAYPQDTYYNRMFRSIGIYHRPIASGSNLEEIIEKAYLNTGGYYPTKGILDANGPVTIAGLPAYQNTYRVYGGEPAYELRDVWVEKNDELFTLSFWTQFHNFEDFAAFQSLADRFLQSFHIK